MTMRPLTLAAWLACVPAAACSQGAPAGPHAVEAAPLDAAFFAAAVRYFADRDSLPVRVDPRPLRPEARLYSVTHADLLVGQPDVVRMRTVVAETAGWAVADAVTDWTCVFAEGYPPARPPAGAAADSIRVHREACRRNGRYQSLIFGLPQPGPEPGRWRLRTMRMLLHGFEGMDLHLERGASGAWNVVAVEDRTGAFS